MTIANGTTLVRNSCLVDDTGSLAVPDVALPIRDGRIEFAGHASPVCGDAIDANGVTIVPALVEAQCRLMYVNVAELQDFDFK